MTSRHAAIVVIACSVLACSSETSDSEKPKEQPFHGTVLGVPFDPVDATAFVMEPMACETLAGSAEETFTTIEIRFSSEPGVCQLANDVSFCGEKAGTTIAYVAVTRGDVDGGLVQPIGPGTYRDQDTRVVDANGVVFWVWSDATIYDAACTGTTGKEGGVGWVTFDEVGPTHVRGSASMTFQNGDTLSGTFDAPICAASGAEYCASLKGGCEKQGFSCVP